VPREALTRVIAEPAKKLQRLLQKLIDSGLVETMQDKRVKGRGKPRQLYRAVKRRKHQRRVKYAYIPAPGGVDAREAYDDAVWWVVELLMDNGGTMHLKDVCWTLRNRLTSGGSRYTYKQIGDIVDGMVKGGSLTKIGGNDALEFLGRRRGGPGGRPVLIQMNENTPSLGDKPGYRARMEAEAARAAASKTRVSVPPVGGAGSVPAKKKRGRPSRKDLLDRMSPMERLEEAVKEQDLDLVPELEDLPEVGTEEWGKVSYDQALMIARRHYTRVAVPDGFYGDKKKSVQRVRLGLRREESTEDLGEDEGRQLVHPRDRRRIRYADGEVKPLPPREDAPPRVLEVIEGGEDDG
jgi:hypothetical protein